MPHIEAIRLRGTENIEGTILTRISKRVNHASKTTRGVEVSICTNASIANDLAIFLFWKIVPVPSRGSSLGLTIKHELMQFGLVDHAVWFEKEHDSSKVKEDNFEPSR